MPNELSNQLEAGDIAELRIAIVVSSFNREVTENLKDGAVKTLCDQGVSDELIDIVRVPGAWEIPLAAQVLAESEEYSANHLPGMRDQRTDQPRPAYQPFCESFARRTRT